MSKLKDTIAAFTEIGTSHNLPESVVQEALAEAMEKAYQKHTGIKDIKVRTEMVNGMLHIYHLRDIVENDEDVEDDVLQISLSDAKKIVPNAEVGGTVPEEVSFSDFDRGAVVLAKNVMKQKIREAEKLEVYENYIDKVGDMVTGYVKSREEKFVLVLLGGTPDGQQQPGSTIAMLKHSDQIPSENYREGSLIPVVITEVNKESKGALVLVSRADPVFVKRLFEKEVPEIYRGIIEIKAIARDAGARAKIAVYSHNENIDPIGACIGPRGTRVQAIIGELNGEKIDILEWSDDIQKLVANALAPAQEVVVIPKEDGKPKSLYAVVPDNQLSLAIGKRGQNARLAVKLTGYKIDIKSQSQMEEMGIDYRTLAKAMHDEYEAAKEQERIYKQQQKIEELKAADEGGVSGVSIDQVGFTFSDELEPDDQHLAHIDTLASVQPAQPAATPAQSQNAGNSDMEDAARMAKENRKSLAERRSQYVSKLEPAAPSAAAPAETAKAEKQEPRHEKKHIPVKKTSFATIKPIYTEEELREIEENELEEELSASWNEDVDYEEYDEYYDDEY